MAQSETVERILDAAEQLFAEKGFAETSLRLITSKAGVNLAAVNYHFGSKKALIQAVFSRFLGPFCASLEKELDRRQAKPEAQHATLEDLLHLLVSQAMAVKPRSGNDLSIFMRLLGLAFSQSQGHLRKYLEEVYGKVFRRYMLLVNEAAPKLPPIELFWRVHFMLGAAAFSMSGIKALRAMAETDFGVNTSTEQVMHLMVPFFAAGMRAESGIDDPLLAGAQLRPRNKTPAKADRRRRPRAPFSFLLFPFSVLRAELHAPGRLHWQARGTAPGLKSFCRVQYSVRCLRPVTAGFADFQAIGLFMQGSLMLDIGGTWLTAEDRQILRHPEVGGLIIFARNIEHPAQVRELCAAIRAIRPDLLLAVDQEGGRVQRLRQGFVRLPAMRAIADNPNAEELAEHCGWLMATEVQAVGLDLSFAPVLDLDHQRSAVVGSRAFEGDPERAALLAGAFIRGMHAAGMAATGKHFPGHGWAEADSHVAIPEDARSLEEIRRSDLVPFARLAGQLDALMPAHVIYPQVDPQPAGFSRRWLQGLIICYYSANIRALSWLPGRRVAVNWSFSEWPVLQASTFRITSTLLSR